MRRLFREATTSFSHLALSSPYHQNPMWHCMRQPMKLLRCSNVPALTVESLTYNRLHAEVYISLNFFSLATTTVFELALILRLYMMI